MRLGGSRKTSTAYQASNLEDSYANQVDCLDREIFERLAPNRLCGRNCEE